MSKKEDSSADKRLRSIVQAVCPERFPMRTMSITLAASLVAFVFLSTAEAAPKSPPGEEELRRVLSEDPRNISVRIELARVLSWKGRLDEALAEIESVLRGSPKNTDALLVKANILRWKGNASEAIKTYREILAVTEDFDAALGLGYALLYSGDKSGAKQIGSALSPKTAYEREELKKFDSAVRAVTGADFKPVFSHYEDSDENKTDSSAISTGVWLDLWRLGLNLQRIDAQDTVRSERAEVFYLDMTAERLSAGAGAVKIDDGDFLTWHLRGALHNGAVTLYAAKTVTTDTARLIENAIRVTTAAISTRRTLGGFDLYGSYEKRRYSDTNSADDFNASIGYGIKEKYLSAGYAVRYLDFERETGNGYFDPEWFISNKFSLRLYFERDGFYFLAEPYFGHQSFSRFSERERDFFSGFSASLGYSSGPLGVELKGESGDYAVGAAAGFRFKTVSLSFNYKP